jgi:uncharacterized protein YndB with AHSA1/START domain
MQDKTREIAVHKTIVVPLRSERAFALFTDRIGTWWPIATHSVGLEHARAVDLDVSVGGELRETLDDGSTALWGTVLELDPPHRLAMTWHPGRDAEDATLLELTFTALGDDATTVSLTHSGWERWEDGRDRRADYDSGWDAVLAGYVSIASATEATS